MKNVHSPSVVRLSPAPKRAGHQVVLTKHAVRAPHKLDTVRVSPQIHTRPHHAFEKRTHQALTASLGMTLATGMLGKLATVLLVPMLFLQPLLPLYAADESVAPAESAPAVEVLPLPPPEPTAETPAVSEEAAPPPDAASVETPASESSESTPVVGEMTEEVAPSAEGEALDIVADNGEPGEEQEGEVAGEATTTPEAEEVITPELPIGGGSGGAPVSEINAGTGSGSDNIVVGEATSTDEAVPSEVAPENREAAEEEIVSAPDADMTQAARDAEVAAQAETARQEAARLAMRKEIEAEITKGCLTIDDVGYYCLKNFEGGVSPVSTTTKITGVQSLPDPEGGDKEIFITRDGESIQLTQNSWDDTFPAMDVTGKSLVWQGMIESRWQIFFTDLSGTTTSPVTVQLTHSTESNFNPRVDGNTVVWQGWASGNWEIFLADHLSPSSYYPDGEEDILPSENRRLGINGEWHVSRLSENDTHDMFPAISGGLVTWQSFQAGSWNVYAYNMKTGESTQLSQGGVKSENPRFAVTWDERDANGNTRMVGYDIASGETIDLTNAARQTPNNPNPYQPDAPISQQNQAALPPTASSGTSTPARADGDDEGGTNGLEI